MTGMLCLTCSYLCQDQYQHINIDVSSGGATLSIIPSDLVIKMTSKWLNPLDARETLSSYIGLLKRLGCRASNQDRPCCLRATSRLPRAARRSLYLPVVVVVMARHRVATRMRA